jgi:DNA-binding LacI/PurR family transcriptional regulator
VSRTHATIVDVARAARVSTATVSRALNGTGQVAPQTRRRVEAAVRELGYEPNRIARSLVMNTTHTIALLLPDISNPFFPDLVKGVQLLAEERRYALLLANTGADPGKEREYLRTLRGKLVDGIILVGLALSGSDIAEALGPGVPVVALDRSIDVPDASLVQVDHRGGARRATSHLLELGHRLVAHVTGPRHLRLTAERVAGYREALADAGAPVEAGLVVPADFTEDGGYAAIDGLLGRGARFTAVFAANDLSAIGTMAALKRLGLRVPEDVSVVGFDDIHLSAYTSPPLTTMRQPTYEMGRRSAELLIGAIEAGSAAAGETITFDAELVVRGSTSPPPGAGAGGLS